MGVPAMTGLPVVQGFPSVATIVTEQQLRIDGDTLDSNGNPLGNCQVDLFRTSDDQIMQHTVSDAGGNYRFYANPAYTYYVVAYLPGSPDVFGTTSNQLVPI